MQAPRRATCPRCERPQSTCICAWAVPIANQARLLILQHPLEVTQAKGSAKLLQLSLRHVERRVGETFEPTALQTWLAADQASTPYTVLLYPAHQTTPKPTSKACSHRRSGWSCSMAPGAKA